MQRQNLNEQKPLLSCNQYPHYTVQISFTKNDKGKDKEKEREEEKLVNDDFEQLPNELIIHIVKFLNFKDLFSFMLVCKRLHQATVNTYADEVIDLRELMRNKEQDNTTEIPIDEKSIIFKNKQDQRYMIGTLFSRMKKCHEIDQNIEKLSQQAERDIEIGEATTADCAKRMFPFVIVTGSSLICSALGGLAVLFANSTMFDNPYPVTSIVGVMCGGVVVGAGTAFTTLYSISSSFSFFGKTKQNKVAQLIPEISNDPAHQLSKRITHRI